MAPASKSALLNIHYYYYYYYYYYSCTILLFLTQIYFNPAPTSTPNRPSNACCQ